MVSSIEVTSDCRGARNDIYVYIHVKLKFVFASDTLLPFCDHHQLLASDNMNRSQRETAISGVAHNVPK
jgi:hypothetical protein